MTGELGKLDMLHESILHQCIKQLLAKKKKAGLKEVVEDLECLCQIMKTIGKGLDNGKATVSSSCVLSEISYIYVWVSTVSMSMF